MKFCPKCGCANPNDYKKCSCGEDISNVEPAYSSKPASKYGLRADVEKAISEFSIKVFGNKENIKRAESMLQNDEKVLFVTPTNITISYTNILNREIIPGVVFLTDKRMIFYYQVLGSVKADTISLDEIRSTNFRCNGLTGGHIQVHTITKSYDILVTYKKNIVQKIQQTFENARNDFMTNKSEDKSPDVIDQIEKLASLREKGIISESEFNSKKNELLSRI